MDPSLPSLTRPYSEPPGAATGGSQQRSDEHTPATEDQFIAAALRFKQSPVRLHPGEQRGASLLIDPGRVPPGTPVQIACDRGVSWKPPGDLVVPEPQRAGWSRLSGVIRARVTAEPGSRLTITVQAAEHRATLEVLIVRHRAGGWVREFARKDEDAEIEAEFDPETGTVTVHEGRREFRVWLVLPAIRETDGDVIGLLQVWDLRSRRFVRETRSPGGALTSAAFSRDGACSSPRADRAWAGRSRPSRSPGTRRLGNREGSRGR